MPLWIKRTRNQAPFMTKELNKSIMSKPRAKYKYVKCSSRENFKQQEKAKGKFNSINRK